MQQSILLIEDEESLARFVELELQHEGYAVVKRFDGREGLDEALQGAYDLILLDIMLPGLNGLEVLRRLRRDNPNIERSIFNSIHAVNLDMMPGYKSGGVLHSFLDDYDERGKKSE